VAPIVDDWVTHPFLDTYSRPVELGRRYTNLKNDFNFFFNF
jgi:hypothetical protein